MGSCWSACWSRARRVLEQKQHQRGPKVYSLNRAREILVRLAKGAGITLRQSYGRVGKFEQRIAIEFLLDEGR